MGPHLPLAALVSAHYRVGLVGAHFVTGYWGSPTAGRYFVVRFIVHANPWQSLARWQSEFTGNAGPAKAGWLDVP